MIDMEILVCIGASCHKKGSLPVVEELQKLIQENGLTDKVQLRGTDCTGQCQQGVCVSIGDTFYSVHPETVDAFFQENVLNKVRDSRA